LSALYLSLSRVGLARLDIHTARDVTSCPGAETCNLAVTSSRALAAQIAERLEAESLHELRAIANTVIKISGCPNSCGQHHVADLGFHGAAKTVNGITVPMYQLHLGGGVDASGARFGRQVVKLVARRVPEAVVALLKLYETDKREGESPAAFFQRVDAKRVVGALGDIVARTPGAGEEADIGQTEGFLVQTGAGECAS
jgi:sulfite reductase beta subunit-like hemoprotein